MVTLRADAGADFGEVEPDSVGPADAVVLGHDDVAHVHADGTAMIYDDLADIVIDQPREEPGAEAESRQGIGDVVFTAAGPDFEGIGKFNSPMSRRR